MRGVFVTGTDTGVGKSVTTAGLAHALRSIGARPGIFKPVQSGHAAGDPAGDVGRLREWSGVDAPPSRLNVYAFEAPLAPLIAAREQGETILLAPILERAAELSRECDVLLVEGAGGLFVPLGERWTIADLARALSMPVLIVARKGLGTVNHAVLTVKAVRELALEVCGVVLNGPEAGVDPSVATNAALIEQFAQVTVVGRLPWLEGTLSAERAAREIAPAIDAAAILEATGTSA
ncbi:MAG: dethiobiotin synthase, partial [Gaiellales bacterium]